MCLLQNCFLGAECIFSQGQLRPSVVCGSSRGEGPGLLGELLLTAWAMLPHNWAWDTWAGGRLLTACFRAILEGCLAAGWVLNRFASCLCYIQVSILPRAGLFRVQKCIFFFKKKSPEKKANDTGLLVCKELFYLFALWEKKIKTLDIGVGSFKEWHIGTVLQVLTLYQWKTDVPWYPWGLLPEAPVEPKNLWMSRPSYKTA